MATELEKQVADLQTQVARLEKALESASNANPNVRVATVMLARETRRLNRQEQAAREVAESKTVKVIVERKAEKVIERTGKGRITTIDASRPIALSSTWRSRGIWIDAPAVLEPFDEKGERIVHKVPQRVYEALKGELVLV